MSPNKYRLPGFVLIIIIFISGILVFFDTQVEHILAYPPPSTSTGYPAPGNTETSTPLAPYAPDDENPYWTTTWTPWPLPTTYVPTPTPSTTTTPQSSTPAPPRKGAGGGYAGQEIHRIADWYYDWWLGNHSWPDTQVEFVPMAASKATNLSNAAIRWEDLATARPPDDPHYWLVFNECENETQCNMTPLQAAAFYRDLVPVMNAIDSDARLIVGGVNANPCGVLWLKEFVNEYRLITGEDVPRAGWHFHLYPELVPINWDWDTPYNLDGCDTWNTPTATPGPTPVWYWPADEHRLNIEHWRKDAWNMIQFVNQYGRPEDEIWITEMGCPHTTDVLTLCPGVENFMREYTNEIMNWLNSPPGSHIDRYAWFMTWGHNYWTNLYDWTPVPTSSSGGLGPMSATTPTPTPQYYLNLSTLGHYYLAITPAPPKGAWLDYVHYQPMIFK